MKTVVSLFALLCFTLSEAHEISEKLKELETTLNALTFGLRNLKEKYDYDFLHQATQKSNLEEQYNKLLTQTDMLINEHKIIAKMEDRNAKLGHDVTEYEREFFKVKAKQPDAGELRLRPTEEIIMRGRVAFTATLSGKETVDLGPFPEKRRMVFKHAISNIGNAYSSLTGVFTAPVKGVYFFNVHIVGPSTSHSAGMLAKNGQNVVMAYAHLRIGTWQKASCSAYLVLESGDTVEVVQMANTVIRDTEDNHTSFNGHFIAAL